MSRESVLLFKPGRQSSNYDCLVEQFDTTCTYSIDEALSALQGRDFKAVVCDLSLQKPFNLDVCAALLDAESNGEAAPVLILSSSDQLDCKIKAFEMGGDDYISPNTPIEEVCVRIRKAVFHKIASEQLKDRLNLANQTAYSVMSDNSDLGTNIQFLLQIHQCDNLDELGQLFLRILSDYRISCSLQLRSLFGIKNMEANGMAKDLESQLLFQMKDGGRYIDFGRRTIVNYGRVSLLIRDMPLDDERRYGAIKDNTFALIQGVDARIKALDEHIKVQEEKKALQKLSQDVRGVMKEIDTSYQTVMRQIATVVEDMADQIDGRIPSLVLTEEQENFFETVVHNCVAETNRIFNEGLKVDECFNRLAASMDRALETLNTAAEDELSSSDKNAVGDSVSSNSSKDLTGSSNVELF